MADRATLRRSLSIACRRLDVATLCCAAALAGCGGEDAAPPRAAAEQRVVARVVSGDTFVLTTGATVRLALIDAPDGGECHAWLSTWTLRRILPPKTRVSLRGVPRLPDVDDRAARLRLVFRDGVNVNLLLARRGLASAYFDGYRAGRLGARVLRAARTAKERRLGAWANCAATLDPSVPWQLQRRRSDRSARVCDPAYPTVCIPPYDVVGDLDCSDVLEYSDFTARAADPHRFDVDANGRGCDRLRPTRAADDLDER